MTKRTIKIEKARETIIEEGVRLLRSGGVIVFPTDTLYGLGADPYNPSAVARIFEIKGRPKDMALPLLLAEVEDLEKVAQEVPAVAWRLAREFLPGALTLVLWKRPEIADPVTGGKTTVAVRVPGHPVPRELARRLGRPITGTSANLSGKPGSRTAQEAAAQLGGLVDLIIDGGTCPYGVESTVVDLTGPRPRVIREGIISSSELSRVLGVPLN